jgi:hypothetical protein
MQPSALLKKMNFSFAVENSGPKIFWPLNFSTFGESLLSLKLKNNRNLFQIKFFQDLQVTGKQSK